MKGIDKLRAREQKERQMEEQQGLCYHCGKPWTLSDPPEASHIIIKKYAFEYGAELINHPLNVPICHKTCNQKVILSPYKQSGKDHIQMIRATME
jgi:hypothetical protein